MFPWEPGHEQGQAAIPPTEPPRPPPSSAVTPGTHRPALPTRAGEMEVSRE